MKTKSEPIYERLAPGDVLIIAKNEDGSFEVAENRNGKVILRKVIRSSESNANDLERIAESGVLPMIVTNNDDPDTIEEVFICSSIAGGADFKENMPASLELTRVKKDGTEYKHRYIQEDID